jgi:hypothetical protein
VAESSRNNGAVHQPHVDRYALRAPDHFWKETSSALLVPDVAPQYVFRGECGDFSTTLSSAHRPSTNDAAVPDQELVQLTESLIWRLQCDDFKLDRQGALALLQHYGFPTTIIDFTGHLGYAFAFASKNPCPVARVAVMPRKLVSPARVIDLTEHEWAERARRQAAFGLVIPAGLTDLKSEMARLRLNISWYEFPVLPTDSEFFRAPYQEILSISDDPSAGFLRFFITEYVEAHGKLSPALREWLLKLIPIAPQCYLVKAFEGNEVVVNFRGSQTLDVFNGTIESEYTRKYWSGERQSWERMQNWTWPQVGSVVADPRTHHPDSY